MKKSTPDIKILVANMLNLGVEPGRCSISIRPESCKFYFAYDGQDANKESARIAIREYLEAMYSAQDISLTSNQYAKSRFRYCAEFSSPCQIDPSHYTVEKVDLSKF